MGSQDVVRPEEVWVDFATLGKHHLRVIEAIEPAESQRKTRTVREMQRVLLHRPLELFDGFAAAP